MSDPSFFAKNLNYLMEKHGLNANSLQDKSNITQTTTSRILNGTTKNPRDQVVQQYAKFFGVSLADLRYKDLTNHDAASSNNEAPWDNNVQPIPPSQLIKQAPVLNSIQAGKFTNMGDNSYDEYLPYFGDYGKDNVYWLKIQGDSMMTDFKEGEYVLINKDRQPTAGNYVAALQEGKEQATFKKYRPKGFDENGIEYWHLVPSNPEFPIIDSRHQPFEVLGVAVERNQKLV